MTCLMRTLRTDLRPSSASSLTMKASEERQIAASTRTVGDASEDESAMVSLSWSSEKREAGEMRRKGEERERGEREGREKEREKWWRTRESESETEKKRERERDREKERERERDEERRIETIRERSKESASTHPIVSQG